MPSPCSLPTPQAIDDLIQQARDLRMKNTRSALELAHTARSLALMIDYQKGLAYSLHLICLCRFILADDGDLLNDAFQVLSLFEGLSDQSGTANAHNLLAIIHKRRNQLADAMDHFQRSLSLRREIDDPTGQSISLNNIGLLHRIESRWDLALDCLFQALQLAEASDDPESASYALANIAMVYFETSEYERARRFAQRGLDLNHGTNDRALDSTLLTLLGKIHHRLTEPDPAIDCLTRSLEISRQTGNINDEGDALLALGLVYQDLQQFHKSDETLRSALEIMQRMNSRNDEAEVLYAIGCGFQKQGNLRTALNVLQQSLNAAQDGQLTEQIQDVHLQMAGIHEALGEFQPALQHFRTYHEIVTRSQCGEVTRRVRDMTSTWELQHDPGQSKISELSEALLALRNADEKNAALLNRLQKQAELLEQLAREDGLTGVANRRWLDLKLAQEFERAQRFGHSLSIALIDIDDFKLVNDRFSHPVGDAALVKVASLMRDLLRAVDVIGRYGGEEFLLILVETDRKRAQTVCDRLLRSVSEYDWNTVHPGLHQITLSIGIVSHIPVVGPEFESIVQMVERADTLMYNAKRQGKNRICSELNIRNEE